MSSSRSFSRAAAVPKHTTALRASSMPSRPLSQLAAAKNSPSPIRLFHVGIRANFRRSFHSPSASLIQKTVDRPSPDVLGKRRQNRIYFAVFCAVMALSLGIMVKYEAANSPIVTSTSQAIRRSPATLAELGPNIRFTSSMPWVTGNTGIAKEVVDFTYDAMGDAGSGTVRFRAVKVPGEMRYTMERWSVTPHQGPHKDEEISLIDEAFVPYVPLTNSEEPTVVRNEQTSK